MWIAKIIDRKGRELIAEIRRAGARVSFDPRPGWVLLSAPLDKPERKRESFWLHPDDCLFVWVRHFAFAYPAERPISGEMPETLTPLA